MKKSGLDETQIGKRIDNIPNTGTLTGYWEIDYYGCWWEFVPDKNIETRNWIIGEYPEEVVKEETKKAILKDFLKEIEYYEKEVEVDSDIPSEIAKLYQQDNEIEDLYEYLMNEFYTS